MKSTVAKWQIRALGSLVILGALVWWLPIREITAGFSRMSVELFLFIWAVFVFGHAIAAAKWWLLIGRGMPYAYALKAHVAGLASNLCLPGAAGGDIVRAGVAGLVTRNTAKVVSGSVTDRLIDMLALAILACGATLGLLSDGAASNVAAQVLGMLVVVAVFVMWVLPRFVPWFWGKFPSFPMKKLALTIAEEFSLLAKNPCRLVGILIISVSIQSLFVILAMFVGQKIGVNVALSVWFFAWPLAKLLAVIPVSLNGLGVREVALAALIVPFGAKSVDVVASGLVWQAVLFLTGGLGAVVLAVSGFKYRAVPPTSE